LTLTQSLKMLRQSLKMSRLLKLTANFLWSRNNK
jgi:hypothetical protein